MATLDTVVSFKVSSQSRMRANPKVLVARFGDGYEQRIKDGINPNLRTWDLTWTNISLVNAGLLHAFFEAQIGLRFTWTQPIPFDGEGAKTWISDVFGIQYSGGLVSAYTATLEQRPA